MHCGERRNKQGSARGGVVLLVLLLIASSSFALPYGGGRFSLIHRHTRQDQGESFPKAVDRSLVRLDLFQTVPGYGRLFSSVDFSRIDERDRISRFQAGLQGFHLGGRVYTLIAGDTSLRFSNLVEGFPGPHQSLFSVMPIRNAPLRFEPGRFINTIYPDIYFRGATLHSAGRRDTLTLFGGTLAELKGFQANEYDLGDDSLYGLKWRRALSEGFYIGLGLARAEGPLRRDALSSDNDNTLLLADASLALNDHLRFIGEFRRSHFNREDDRGVDLAYRVGPMLAWEKVSIEANYRYAGPDFVLFRETLQTEKDVEGVFANIEYRHRPALTFFHSLNWSSSNVEDDGQRPAIDSWSALLGGYYFGRGHPSLNVRISFNERRSRGVSSVPVDSRLYALYIETARRFDKVEPYLRLRGERGRDEIVPDDSDRSGSILFGTRFFPLPRLSLFLEGEKEVRETDGGSRSDSENVRSGANWTLPAGGSLNANLQYSHIENDPEDVHLRTLSANTALTWSLPRKFQLGALVRYIYNRTDNATETSTSNLQLELRLSRRFDWGSRERSSLAPRTGTPSLAAVGHIEGYVFEDRNQNGVRDPGERGFADIRLSLGDQGGSETLTDAEGSFAFRNVATGVHVVRLDERRLPVDFNLLTAAERRVEVDLRETVSAAFPLIRTGQLEGRVLLDRNENGLADSEDEPLSDILVYLDGTQINTFTDSSGRFRIQNLLPGRYEVKIDPVWLAADMEPIPPTSHILTLESGDTLTELDFLIRRKGPRVIRKVFPAAE